jgi:hypothetical protein
MDIMYGITVFGLFKALKNNELEYTEVHDGGYHHDQKENGCNLFFQAHTVFS